MRDRVSPPWRGEFPLLRLDLLIDLAVHHVEGRAAAPHHGPRATTHKLPHGARTRPAEEPPESSCMAVRRWCLQLDRTRTRLTTQRMKTLKTPSLFGPCYESAHTRSLDADRQLSGTVLLRIFAASPLRARCLHPCRHSAKTNHLGQRTLSGHSSLRCSRGSEMTGCAATRALSTLVRRAISAR